MVEQKGRNLAHVALATQYAHAQPALAQRPHLAARVLGRERLLVLRLKDGDLAAQRVAKEVGAPRAFGSELGQKEGIQS